LLMLLLLTPWPYITHLTALAALLNLLWSSHTKYVIFVDFGACNWS
jgi:hypothetical protein